MRKLKLFKLWLTLGWLLIATVIFLSLLPSLQDTDIFSGSDKLAHISAYAAIMLWFGCIYYPGRIYLKLGLCFILMGTLLEIIQGITGYRSMEYLDMLANFTGVLAGWILSKTPISYILIYSERRLGIQSKI